MSRRRFLFVSWAFRALRALLVCLTMQAVGIALTVAEEPGGDSQSTGKGLPPTGRARVSWKIDLHPQVAKAVRDVLIVEAEERADAGKSNRQATQMKDVLAFRGNVRVWLKDGSMTVNADEAAVTIEYPNNSRTSIDMVTVTLSGNVRGNSDGVDVTGEQLLLLLRPLQGDDAAARYDVEWKLEGAGQIEGRNFTGKADRVALVSYQEKGPSKAKRAKVVLNGNAQLKRGKSGNINGSRIEFTTDHGEFRLGS